MKKVIKCVSLVLAVIAISLMLSACVAPNKDYAVAARQLKEKGYDVQHYYFEDTWFEGKAYEGFIAVKYGEDHDIVTAEDKIIVFYFNTVEYAKECEQMIIAEHDQDSELKRRYDELGKKYDIFCGRKGNIVWDGTKQALKDAS